MNRIVTLSAALLLCSSVAMAQGVNLYLNDCGAGSSVHTVTNACTSNSGIAFVAYGSCVVPRVTKQAFIGTMNVIDIQTSAATIPDWWRADDCRATGFALVTDATLGGSCPTIWDRVPPAGNNIFALPFVGGSARVRFLLGVVLYSYDAYDLVGDGTTELSVFKWIVLNQKSVGAGACGGCSTGACIVLNDVQIQGLYDHTVADFIDITNPLGSNSITYNTGAPVCAGSTPTQNRTWGALKSLYR